MKVGPSPMDGSLVKYKKLDSNHYYPVDLTDTFYVKSEVYI